jgi:carbonic anhydrase/acetyltransferase-like protein (isoleucine patch superfamily)
MSEFSVSSLLEVEVSQSSLRAARSEIEDGLGDIEVDVSASASEQLSRGGSGGQRLAGKERAMTRSLLDTQTERITTVSENVEANLELNETRNDLLRDLVDAQERTARKGSRGPLSSMGSAVLGLAGGGLAIAGLLASELASVNWTSVVGDAIPDIAPGDIVNGVGVAASDVISSAASVSASDVINSGASVGVDALVATGATIPASALIDSAATVSPETLVLSGASVTVGALVASKATISADDAVSSAAVVWASDVIESGADVGVTALVANAATVTAGALIAEKAVLSIDDLLSRDDSGSSTGATDPSIADRIATGAVTTGAMTVDALQGGADWAGDNAGGIATLGGTAAAAKGLASRFPASGGAFALTDEQARQGVKRSGEFGSWVQDQLGLGDSSSSNRDQPVSSGNARKEQAYGSHSRPNRARESRRSGEVTVNQEFTFDTRTLERKLDEAARDLESRISSIESDIDSLSRGR